MESLWETVWQVLKNLNIELTIRPSKLTPGYILKRIENICSHKNLSIKIHNSIIYNGQKWKQARCSSTDEWMSEIWTSYTTEQYLTIKGDEILIHATT